MHHITMEMVKDSGKMELAKKAYSAVMSCMPIQYYGRRIYSLVASYLLYKEAESRSTNRPEEVFVNPLALRYAENSRLAG